MYLKYKNNMENKRLDKIIHKNIGVDISYQLYSKYISTDIYNNLEKQKYLSNIPVDDYY